ncbi:MAG TPA: Ig-like domain-containing protein [Thiopseudomonas sp.]|nr:Ig-like domain-containing protein [Thiopseudomonas sp.]
MIGKSIGVSEKTSGESVSLEWTNSVALESTSVVKMPFGPESVGSYEANGEDLIINLKSGESVTVQDFFTLFGYEDELNELVLQDENGVLWSAQLDPVLGEFTFTEIASLDIATDSVAGFASSVPGWLKIGLAALAVGGIAASKSSGGSSSNNEFAYDDGSAPEALTDLTINDEGTVITGRGQPGADVTIFIKGPSDSVVVVVVGEGIVQGDGNFEITLYEAQIDGEILVATQKNSTGKISPDTFLTAPDTTEPGTLSLKFNKDYDDGAVVTVTGEPGATVTITSPTGAVIGQDTVGATGTVDVILIIPQTNGETLTATQTDAADNKSPEVTIVAPDTTSPIAPEIAIDDAGAVVTVTGEPGAKVSITSPTEAVIGLGTVGDTGTVDVILITPQINGEKLTATQTDAAGNTSPTTSVLAPGGAAPIAPVLVIDSAGKVVTVEGEAGAKVMITTNEPFGALIGLGVVGTSGTVDIILITPQINGEKLTATQINGSGKESPEGTVTAYDTTDPTAPKLEIITSKIVKVTGEPGAKVDITDPDGVQIGLGTVGAAGTVNVTLITPQINGETLTVTQTDAAGNISPEATVIAPGGTAPGAPILVIYDAGDVVKVTGKPGAQVVIKDPTGLNIGAANIGPSGMVEITLLTPQTNGETLTATQTDTAGHTSPESTVTAKDTTPPKAPELVIDSAGEIVTVTGEVGAIVTVVNPSGGGSPIGVGIIGASGQVDITLVIPQASGKKLTATQMDSAGNVSPKGSANVPSGSKSKALFAEADDDTDIMMMGKAESDATVEAKDDTAMATGLASQYSSLSIDLSGVEDFSAIDEEQEFAALSVSFDDVLSIEDGDDFAPLLEPEEGQAFTIASTENSVVDIAGYDVQPVVDPLDDLLDQDNLYI